MRLEGSAWPLSRAYYYAYLSALKRGNFTFQEKYFKGEMMMKERKIIPKSLVFMSR